MYGVETNDDELGLLSTDMQDENINGPKSFSDNDVCELGDQERKEQLRNHVGFWILGLTNNFAYVVMLSAAFDILGNHVKSEGKNNKVNKYHCNPISTGTILLADVLPSVILKWTAPFFMQQISYRIRISFVFFFTIGGLLLVALCRNLALIILGVILTSISSGLGEITFLSLTSHFQCSTITSWSSGTGAAGVFASLIYAGLTSSGVSPKNTILIMLFIPFLMAFGYWGLLRPNHTVDVTHHTVDVTIQTDRSSLIRKRSLEATGSMNMKEKIYLLRPLFKYMVPLFLVYFAEYLINQGLSELLYYKNSIMNQSQQYRWFQFCYQFGVLLSRSSVYCFKIEKIELLTAFQYINFIVLLLEAYYRFIPNVWITLGISLFEGLVGGAVYVNAFYRVSTEVESKYREFSMGAASMADSTGITLAGLVAIQLHNYLCSNAKSPI